MIDLDHFRQNPQAYRKAASERHVPVDVEGTIAADEEHRTLLQQVEQLRHDLNQSGAPADEAAREALRQKKHELKEKESALTDVKKQLEKLLRQFPNLQRPDVPVGESEDDNIIVKIVGEPKQFSFEPLEYLKLSERHDLIDTERAGKVSGTRFAYLKNEGALLSQALVRYAFDIALTEKFVPVLPPVLVREESMEGMGYLEHGGEDETYHFEKDNLYLVGTSEQSIGPMHMGEILEEAQLPIRYVGFSSCFRREAGASGKDTRGILRVHQFDKVEMFSITTPEQSDEEQEYLLSLEEKLMSGLGLPYRVVKLCTGDIGWPSARTYDIQTWIPSEKKYRETHSASTTTDFQSRRLKIRYRTTNGDIRFVHLLNGTLVAVNRPLIALLEHGQRADGSIEIPEVLHPYLYGRTSIGA